MKAGAPLKRKSRIKPISAKNRKLEAELRRSKKLVRERSEGRCEFNRWLGAPGGGEIVCLSTAVHVHHIKPRSHGVDHRPENLLHLCDSCHSEIHAHPEWAYEQGYLKRSGGER